MKTKVSEEYREIMFDNGQKLKLLNISEVDNSGSYLRLITEDEYYLINSSRVLYHKLNKKDKVF